MSSLIHTSHRRRNKKCICQKIRLEFAKLVSEIELLKAQVREIKNGGGGAQAAGDVAVAAAERKRKREFKKLRKAVIRDKNAAKTQIFENMQGQEVVAPRFQRITRMKTEKYQERVLFALEFLKENLIEINNTNVRCFAIGAKMANYYFAKYKDLILQYKEEQQAKLIAQVVQ